MRRFFQSERGTRRAAWLALPAFLALFAVAGLGNAQPVHAQTGSLTIQVQLVDPQGVPLPNQGDLSGYSFSLGGALTSTLGPTTANGTIGPVGLPQGNYTITPATTPPGRNFLGIFQGNTQVLGFTVSQNQTTSLVARYQVAGTSAIAITKVVVDANNQPINPQPADRSGFQFQVAGPAGFTPVTLTSDTNGNAAISNLAAGTYAITESPRAGFTFATLIVNGVQTANGAQFNIGAGQQIQVLAYNRGGTTAGNTISVTKQVLDANNNPVTTAGINSGFTLTVICGTAYTQSQITDQNGLATFTGVPAASCTISEAARTGFTRISTLLAGQTVDLGDPGAFTVMANTTTSITIRNRQGTGGGTGQTEQIQLFQGCNNQALTWPAGTQVSTVASSVTGDLIAIWAFDNATQTFRGFSPIPGAPNDFVTTAARAQPVFLCMRSAGTLTRPVI